MDFNFNPPMTTGRAEAIRWLGIAEKLLYARDLVGSKTFAIRARESDPSFEPADQILAVVDTIIAGEKRINNQPDWYAILQLFRQTHDSELIASQFRLLAMLLNPQKNKAPFADQAFRLVVDAWSVLSNPWKKSIYDNDLNLYYRLNNDAPEPQQIEPEPQQIEPEPPQPPPIPQQLPKSNNFVHFEGIVREQRPQQSVREEIPEKIVREERPAERTAVENRERPEQNVREEAPPIRSTNEQNPSFWTACPYCYYMYEYPRVYVDCSLRCQNCRRAFHGSIIPAPPQIVDGKESYFCCWGFFPIGVSSDLEKNKTGGSSNWNPFSTMYTYPEMEGKNEFQEHMDPRAQLRKTDVKKTFTPRVYIDDDDIFLGVSDPSDDSDDDEWGSTKKKKKKKKQKGSFRGRSFARKSGKSPGKPKKPKTGGADVVAPPPPNASSSDPSKKSVSNSSKKTSGRVTRDLGKLDLNVEFSNEVEEPAPPINERNRAGNGEEDNIEGTGFFEGLDEFLSSLPILNVVGDDKVKAS